MRERLFCRDKVRRLFQALLEEGNIKKYAAIVQQEPFPPRAGLLHVLGERLSRRYYNALNALMKELVPHHAPQHDLAQAFWELFGEVATEPASYCLRGRLRSRIDQFTQEWKKPLKLHQIAYKIDNLNLGTESFSFGHVCFFTMNDAELRRWGLSRRRPIHARILKDFVNQSVATIQVQASSGSLAFETGLQEVLITLNFLRLAGVWGRISSLHDEMFLWKFNGAWVALQIGDGNQSITHGWHRQFDPLIVDMGPHIREGLETESSNLLAIASGELPEEITTHLKRAIRWISNSITRKELDDKVVDLCTALEILFLPGYTEGRKGHMIDLRHHIIGGDWHPGVILRLYNLRSDIVHGSTLNVSKYTDYWYLLLMCFTALRLLVSHAKTNPQIQTLEGLIKSIETKENLQDFVDLHEIGIFRGKLAREVKQLAKHRLRKLQEN